MVLEITGLILGEKYEHINLFFWPVILCKTLCHLHWKVFIIIVVLRIFVRGACLFLMPLNLNCGLVKTLQ